MDEGQMIQALVQAAPGIRNGNVSVRFEITYAKQFNVSTTTHATQYTFGVLRASDLQRAISFTMSASVVASMVFLFYDWIISLDLEVWGLSSAQVPAEHHTNLPLPPGSTFLEEENICGRVSVFRQSVCRMSTFPRSIL